MSRPRGWRRLFRIGPFRRDRRRDVAEEIDFHFQEAVERLTAAGMGEGEARREARRRFGDVSHYRRELERIDRGRMMREGWTTWMAERGRDLRHAVRTVARQPGFAAAVVLTFALGIGANAALFGIVDRLVLRPPSDITDPGHVVRLAVLRSFLGRPDTSETMAWDDFKDFRAARGLSRVGAFTQPTLTLGEGTSAERIHATMATDDFVALLGVRARLGRFFGPEDNQFGAPLVAVLGYDLWRDRFGADPGVLGRTVRLAGTPFTIIGVAPRGFTGVGLSRVDVWLPLLPSKVALDGDDRWFSGRGYYFLKVAARLAPGTSVSKAMDEATRLHRAGRAESMKEGHYSADARVVARPLVATVGPYASAENKVALWVAGVSFLVLLIACANVANLLLARSVRQWRENAVRLALGISPLRLLEQTVLDALVLALLGGGVGVAVAHWGGAALRARLLPDVDWTGLDQSRVLWFSLGITVVAGLAAGSAPAVMAARQRLAGALSAGGRGSTLGRRLRGFLTVGQAALASLLLVGAGLFTLSLRAARHTDIGFDVDHLVSVELEASGSLDDAGRTALYRTAMQRVEAMPGVTTAALTSVPFGWSFSGDLRAEGLDSIPSNPAGGPYYHRVSRAYFQTIGMPVIRGRGFEPADFGGNPVAVVNSTMADLLWPGRDPLGRCLYVGNDDPPCSEVVGVAADAHRNELDEEESPQYYLPLEQDGSARALMVRTGGDPGAVAGPLARTLLTELTGVRYVKSQAMRDLLAPQLRGWRMGSTIFALFGALALVVAGVGLYSLLAFDVAERRREIGIRLALGASVERIRSHVVARALTLAAGGVAMGLAVAFFLAPWAGDLLYKVAPHDPSVFGAAAVVLLLAAAAAGILPAVRATRVEPTEALREE